MSLPPNEKLVIQDNFREPMHVAVPFPAWAMRGDEAGHELGPESGPESGNRNDAGTPSFTLNTF